MAHSLTIRLSLATILWLAPSPAPAAHCPHGQFYLVHKHQCIAKATRLPRGHVKSEPHQESHAPEARPDAAQTGAPTQRAASGLTPRDPVTQTSTRQAWPALPYEIPSSYMSRQIVIEWRLKK